MSSIRETETKLMTIAGKVNPLLGIKAVKTYGLWHGRVMVRKSPKDKWVILRRTKKTKKLKKAMLDAAALAEAYYVSMHKMITQAVMQNAKKNGTGSAEKELDNGTNME